MKIKKCLGCGAVLQTIDMNKDGYVNNKETLICQRCFRLQHYNEYKSAVKNNKDYIKILEKINNNKDLVLYVVDIFNLNYDMDMIFNYIKNDTILVITKRDILPKSVKDEKIIDYFKKDTRFLDVILVSADKNYNIDRLYKKLLKYQKTDNVYIVGKTNAGKSTLINKMVNNYSTEQQKITTSSFPSTTLSTIKVEINKYLTITDTPGLIDESDIINYLEINDIKKVTPKKEIKPKVFQTEGISSIVVLPYLRVDIEGNNSLVFYLANDLEIRKNNYKNDNLKDLKAHKLEVKANNDIVVNGLLWIKVIKDCEITLYTYDKVLVYTRDSII